MTEGEVIKIAIIDDDEDDFLLINDIIKNIGGRKFTVDWLYDATAALEHIRSKSHHLYFVDYFLGPFTGIDLLKEASAQQFEIPIILLTGVGNREIDILAMKSGATDYLVKSDLTSEKMERCIRYALERKKFTEELKIRETRYRKLFEGSRDAVFITDTELNFKEVNHSSLLLLDPENGTLIGRNLLDSIEDRVQKARIKDVVRTSGKIDGLEIKFRKDNQEVRTGLLSLYVLDQGEETTLLVHGMIHDITNIRKAELANLLTEKMEANERLVRILAHEIRNPLNNIILSAEQLQENKQQEAQAMLLSIVQRNSLRINQIISELLSLANPGDLDFKKYSLQELIDESLKQASDRIILHKINVEKKYPNNPLTISADKNRLVIAFTNILINAVEAMSSGNGHLCISIESAEDNYLIAIKDNGKGIPAEYLSKLFEPLFTLKKNGMGLGLTASFSIIQAHKATINVDSIEGKGTSFYMRFNKPD